MERMSRTACFLSSHTELKPCTAAVLSAGRLRPQPQAISSPGAGAC